MYTFIIKRDCQILRFPLLSSVIFLQRFLSHSLWNDGNGWQLCFVDLIFQPIFWYGNRCCTTVYAETAIIESVVVWKLNPPVTINLILIQKVNIYLDFYLFSFQYRVEFGSSRRRWKKSNSPFFVDLSSKPKKINFL